MPQAGPRASPGSAPRTPRRKVGTAWNTPDIWLVRDIDLPGSPSSGLQLWLHHDEDVEVYVNGVPAFKASGYLSEYEAVPMAAAAIQALRPGKNLVAVHCHQTGGGQYVDCGLVSVQQP